MTGRDFTIDVKGEMRVECTPDNDFIARIEEGSYRWVAVTRDELPLLIAALQNVQEFTA